MWKTPRFDIKGFPGTTISEIHPTISHIQIDSRYCVLCALPVVAFTSCMICAFKKKLHDM